MTAAEEADFTALAARLASRGGLDVGIYKDRCVRRRIAVRMRACGANTYGEYLGVLDREPGELDQLLDALTINVTKFFRNRDTWTWLGSHLLPGLLRRDEGRLRVWSAGCSSGEEPYTIAMLVAEVLGRIGQSPWLERVRIDATDIDRRSLERANAGVYPLRAFDESDPEVIERWTTPVDAEHRGVRPELKALLRIRSRDLVAQGPLEPPYDLITCRNVLIYFDRATQDLLIRSYADALAAGGCLVLGRVETILGDVRSRFELVEPRERIYRKAA